MAKLETKSHPKDKRDDDDDKIYASFDPCYGFSKMSSFKSRLLLSHEYNDSHDSLLAKEIMPHRVVDFNYFS